MKKTYFLLLSVLLLLLVDDVKAQLKLGDQPTSIQKSVILDLQGSNGRQGVWLPRITDTTNATGIDALNPPDGVLIYHTPSAQVMIRKNGFWSSLQTTTKVGSTTSTHSIIEFQLGTAAGTSKDVNYSLNSSTGVITLNMPDAAVDTRGIVSIGSQTFGGLKTFNDGLTSLSTTTISGASSNASNLYLGVTSATTPGTTTDRFLSVDNSGRVVLSQGLPSTRTMTINGTSYDLSANRTWNVGTVTSLTGGYGLNGGTITSSGTLSLDTTAISTRAWRQKGIDSVVALINGYVPNIRTLNGLALSSNQMFTTGTTGADFNISSSGTTHTFNIPTASATNRGLLSSADWTTFNNKVATTRTITINGTTQDLSANRTWSVGTVTSVAGGYGLNGGTITTSGTLSLDTTAISTRAWRQKGIDSVAALINGFVPSTRSINGLSLAFNHTFSIGASGTDFNIVSGGSTHTFNMPTASATNRGLLSSTDWTTFNNKVPSTRTLNGLALSNDQTFTTGTSGADFNISSTGTTHTFNIPDASATARGAVSTSAQTFAGLKTFSTGVTVSGATSNASNLTLGITSATTPGASTDRYLTVDNTGKVVLSTVSGVTSLGAIGASPNANGASITSGVLNLQPASASFGGVVTTGTQTIAGQKTFSTGVTVSGATSNASNLTLGITSATTPGTATDNFLTVNSSGKVTLNPVPVAAPNGAVKIKNYTEELDGMPNSLNPNTSGEYTFTIAGANFSTTSVVYISPTQDLETTTTINWVRVVNSTTIRVSFSAGSSKQNFTPGNSSTFNITVIEF
jgi:predicted heme/steroid binding protein